MFSVLWLTFKTLYPGLLCAFGFVALVRLVQLWFKFNRKVGRLK